MVSLLKMLTTFLLVGQCFTSMALAYEEGMRLGRNGQIHWTLERKLGSGSFGGVFEAAAISDQENRYAVKIFKKDDIGERAFAHYSHIKEFFREHRHPNIINVGSPEHYDVIDKRDETVGTTAVLFFELSDGSVETFIDQFRPELGDSPKAIREKFKRLAGLKQDVVEAISYLYTRGVSHYDLNPRNVLVNGNRYLVGDLDSVAPLDTKPMTSAWEYSYAPIEWSDGGETASYTLTHLGDVWSLASVLYFALFGETPLENYYFKVFPPQKDFSLAELRVHMRQFPEKHQAFDRMVAQRIRKFRLTLTEANGVFDTDYANISSVLSFIEAGLRRDLLERQTEVVKIIPTFILKRGAGCWDKFQLRHAM